MWLLIGLAILLASVLFLLAPSWSTGLLRVGAAVAVPVLIGWFAIRVIADAVAQAAHTPEGKARWPTSPVLLCTRFNQSPRF